VLSKISRFLGVEIPAQMIEAGFDKHGTSASRDESIGRWRSDMTEGEVAYFVPQIQEAIEAFGYK
jgi:hypothetical protein